MVDVRGIAVRLTRRRDRGPIAPDVCRAPFSSMYLDQHGSVRACCQNTEHPLGNVTEHRLRDIWDGPAAASLRDAMLANDLEHGCAFCKWQVAEGNEALVFARTFDHLAVESLEPPWPQQLELSMSNACNLQCVMCNGDWSSAIRTNREHRPPLPQVYDDQFFEDLRPFLEHVRVVKILGGEPFLGKESLRVMEMLVEMGSTAEVHVTTNGTQWSPRVERILERLPMVIIVSLDGVEREAYESIRIGADLDVVLENLERFRRFAATHGTAVNLAHCLMTSNWRQFPDFLRFAEARGLRTYVNTVTYPNSLSLFHLPPARLREIVETFEAADSELQNELTLNRSLWNDQLHRLRTRLAGLQHADGVDYYLGILGFPLVADHESGVEASRLAAAEEGPEVVHLRFDLDGRLAEQVDTGAASIGDLTDLVGQDIEAVTARLGAHSITPAVVSNPTASHPDVRHWRLRLDDAAGSVVSMFISPTRDDEGVIVEFHAHVASRPTVTADATAPLEPIVPVSELAEAFRAEHPVVHEVMIGPDGCVGTVEPASTPLGTALTAMSGLDAAGLYDVLVDQLGAIVEQTDHPVEGDDTAKRHRVRFDGRSGAQHELEALALVLPTRFLGGAETLVLFAEIG